MIYLLLIVSFFTLPVALIFFTLLILNWLSSDDRSAVSRKSMPFVGVVTVPPTILWVALHARPNHGSETIFDISLPMALMLLACVFSTILFALWGGARLLKKNFHAKLYQLWFGTAALVIYPLGVITFFQIVV